MEIQTAMLPGVGLQVLEAFLLLPLLLQFTEGKRCIKREEIGDRENNDYECNHPVYSECCERAFHFTCCEPAQSKTIREELQLWGMVAAMVLVGVVIYACLIKDTEYIRSDNVREAARNLGRKFGIGKKGEDETAMVSRCHVSRPTATVQSSVNKSFSNPPTAFHAV